MSQTWTLVVGKYGAVIERNGYGPKSFAAWLRRCRGKFSQVQSITWRYGAR